MAIPTDVYSKNPLTNFYTRDQLTNGYLDAFSPEEVEAKNLLMTFIQTKAFEHLVGDLSSFKEALIKADAEKNPFEFQGLLFRELIEQAEESGHLDEKVGKLFFDGGIDQVRFVRAISHEAIAYIETGERHAIRIRQKAAEIKQWYPQVAALGRRGAEQMAANMLHLPYKG